MLGNLLDSYERALAESQCRASISLMFDSMSHGDRYKAYGIGARAAQIPNTLFSAYAVKIVADGSNQR